MKPKNKQLMTMNKTKVGFMSKPVDDMMYDALQGVEKGGRVTLVMREGKFGTFASLEFMSKDDVEAYAKAHPRPENL